MKFLILAALVAVAAADYHDDTFHFSSLGSATGLSGLSGLQKSSLKQYTVQAVPAYRQQYAAVRQVAAPVLAQVAVQQPAVLQYSQYSSAPAAFASSASYSGLNAPKWRIVSQVQEADPAGPYKLSYATENGIQVSEQGSLVNSAEGPAVAAQGSYSYTGDDGQVYSVSYVADENGFRAAGDHLPTPPPIPAEILRSLEENARSGEQYDEQGRLLRN
ncbi:endocuticle structural glycoprotein SgAbd-8-like [Thrips palmi]|uniref:Endocuticle structural glycoprotein SgAbd-8-like n=1 Tax=Thrips palmi TaxID=161013 RepID=A0A6P8Z0X1_THRPL|nr:endocuticle structural glycoprotein SgAbd-8-like [Thrips palmi]